jgi:F-type H+-transporting ATPase subunit b
MLNGFTIVAQIANFLILVALLKHFLYGPIVRAMDKREETIRSRLREAETKREEAEQRAADYEARKNDLEQQRQDLLDQARRDAEEERKKRLRKAREDVDALSKEWRRAVSRNREHLLDDIRAGIGRQAVVLARQVLRDMADAHIQQRLIQGFTERLEQLDENDKTAIRDALKKSDAPVTVRSAFELRADERETVKEAVRKQFGDVDDMVFERSDSLICGLELAVSGRKTAWSMETYLEHIADEIDRTLREVQPDENGERS